MTELIINSPSLQSLHQRYMSTLLKFLFWALWIFLWTPLVTLAGWLAGAHLTYFEMVRLNGWTEVVHDFKIFMLCVAVIGGALGLWAAYNYYRFRGVERRKAFPPVEKRQLAEFFNVNIVDLALQQKAQCLAVAFDERGRIINSNEMVSGVPLR